MLNGIVLMERRKETLKMYCELCKKNNQTNRMGMTLKDVNGNMEVRLCQPCLKKLKNAVKNPRQMVVEIYPVKTNEEEV